MPKREILKDVPMKVLEAVNQNAAIISFIGAMGQQNVTKELLQQQSISISGVILGLLQGAGLKGQPGNLKVDFEKKTITITQPERPEAKPDKDDVIIEKLDKLLEKI